MSVFKHGETPSSIAAEKRLEDEKIPKDHDNHVRRMRAHMSLPAMAGMIPLKEASNLATKASIAGMQGDNEKMLQLMIEARNKAGEYDNFIRKQILALHPDFHTWNIIKQQRWRKARGLAGWSI